MELIRKERIMKEILAYSIDITVPVSLIRTGKSEGLNSDWIHPTAELADTELIIVTKGTLYLQHEDQKYTITAGEYLLLHPGQTSGMTKNSSLRKGFRKSECSFYWIHFKCTRITPRTTLIPDLINDGCCDLFLPVQGRLKQPEKALLLLIRLQDSIKNGYTSCYTNLLSTLILSEISNQHTLQIANGQMESPTRAEKIYHDVKDYITYYINSDIKISDIAARFHYNEKYLSRLFKKYSGYSLKEYIQKQKISNANFLLLDSNMSVKEIAEHLGFSNYHSFEVCYKKYSSYSPTEYRNLFSNRIINYD